MKDTLPRRVRLGVFELDLRAGELCDGERTIRLQQQPFLLLLMLVQANGELVTREQIMKELWPNDTVVEFDHSINAAIKKLRKALGDSVETPQYIETVARRGYRLLMPVLILASGKDPVPAGKPQLPPAHGAGATKEPDDQLSSSGTASLIGKKVSHYRVLQVIGAGGMGLVYKAEDLKLGRQVALKFLPEDLVGDPGSLHRFEREAQTASSLNHPNICTIYEIEEHDGKPFIVMELLEGETLRDRVARSAVAQQAVPLDQLLDVGVKIATGLQAAHEKGIIHRDIKPANVFLTTFGQVKLLDFGIAKLLKGTPSAGDPEDRTDRKAEGANPGTRDNTLTRTGAMLGTAGYMSPEQIRGEKLDARTDIFSFGLVLYEMATGTEPFGGETETYSSMTPSSTANLHLCVILHRRFRPNWKLLLAGACKKTGTGAFSRSRKYAESYRSCSMSHGLTTRSKGRHLLGRVAPPMSVAGSIVWPLLRLSFSTHSSRIQACQ